MALLRNPALAKGVKLPMWQNLFQTVVTGVVIELIAHYLLKWLDRDNTKK